MSVDMEVTATPHTRGQAEDKLQRERGANNLGHVGRHDSELGDDPQRIPRRGRILVSHHAREVPSGGEAEANAQRLDVQSAEGGHKRTHRACTRRDILACRSLSKLPGSTYAMHIRKPGPTKAATSSS